MLTPDGGVPRGNDEEHVRKRWSVLIVGQSGLATSHRAEVGRHRSEATARRAAEVEWQRLVATRGGSSHGYRVVLEHDGEEVPMERVLPHPEEPPLPSPEPLAVTSPLNGSNGHAAAPLVEVQPVPARASGRERPPRPEIPETPAGPVPEDILARWAREEPAGRER